MIISKYKINLLSFFYLLIIILLTRQVPLQEYSVIMNISTSILVILYLYFSIDYLKLNLENKFIIIFFFLLLFHFFYSIFFTKAEFLNSLRFLLIISTIILAYKIKIQSIIITKYFLFFIIIQAIFIIILELLLIIFNDITFYNFIRQTATSNGWGDIYTLNNIYYNIQVKGNALLPVAFMITFLNNLKIKRIFLIRYIILIAVFFSGNFAYLIAITIYLVIMNIYRITTFRHLYKWFVYSLLLITLLAYPIYSYIENKISEKKEDSIHERYQQADLLLYELQKTPLTFLLGLGQGATLEKTTSTRDYRGLTYFELQPIYFLYQLGIVFFLLFIFLYFFLSFIYFKNKIILSIYLCYIIYSSTNPYIFDTNNFIVIILLNSLQLNYTKLNKSQTTLLVV